MFYFDALNIMWIQLLWYSPGCRMQIQRKDTSIFVLQLYYLDLIKKLLGNFFQSCSLTFIAVAKQVSLFTSRTDQILCVFNNFINAIMPVSTLELVRLYFATDDLWAYSM